MKYLEVRPRITLSLPALETRMGGNQVDSGEKDFLKYGKEKRVCKHSTTTLTQLSRDDGSEMKQGSGVRKLIRARDTAEVKCHHSRPLHAKSSRSTLRALLGLLPSFRPIGVSVTKCPGGCDQAPAQRHHREGRRK